MNLHIKTFIVGPIENNTYLLWDEATREAALVDPAAPNREIEQFLDENDLNLKQIWITHAHFDHISGVPWFTEQKAGVLDCYMHPAALPLWESMGGARDFGFEFDPGPAPNKNISDGDTLSLGKYQFQVLHTPGHTPGHVTFYNGEACAAFCGDLIFYHGVGRTDLVGSSESELIKSIKSRIFTLPDETILYPGHGKSTTVSEEKLHNPFL